MRRDIDLVVRTARYKNAKRKSYTAKVDFGSRPRYRSFSSPSFPCLFSFFSFPSYLSCLGGKTPYTFAGLWFLRCLGRSLSWNRIWCILALKNDVWRQ